MSEKDSIVEGIFDDLKAVLRPGERLIVAVLPDGDIAADLVDAHDDSRIVIGLQGVISVLAFRLES